MLRNIMKVAAGAVAAGALALGTASAAQAGDGPDYDPSQYGGVNVLSNICAAPWYWEGPLNIGTVGSSTDYTACVGNYDEPAGVDVASNLCLLPWHWEGPGNALTLADTTYYTACSFNY